MKDLAPEKELSPEQKLDSDVAGFLAEMDWESDPSEQDCERRFRAVALEGERSIGVIQLRDIHSGLVTRTVVSLFDNNVNKVPVDLYWGPNDSALLPDWAAPHTDALKEALLADEPMGSELEDEKLEDKKE